MTYFDLMFQLGKTIVSEDIPVKELTEFFALNYDKRDICDTACSLDHDLEVPIYKCFG